jgi:hypothetical protein
MPDFDLLAMHNFNVLGSVPPCAGLYAWSLDRADDDLVDLRYVGHSEHLPMVTHGKTLDLRSAPGNRYGRPDDAGSSRMWVNAMLTLSKSQGRTPHIWVRHTEAMVAKFYRLCAEHQAINRWQTRIPPKGGYGWNRQ